MAFIHSIFEHFSQFLKPTFFPHLSFLAASIVIVLLLFVLHFRFDSLASATFTWAGLLFDSRKRKSEQISDKKKVKEFLLEIYIELIHILSEYCSEFFRDFRKKSRLTHIGKCQKKMLTQIETCCCYRR